MPLPGARRVALALALTSLAALTFGSSVAAASPSTKRVSVSTAGVEGDDHNGGAKASGNGRYVVFIARSDLLSPADSNGDWDIYLRDRKTRKTEWISRGRPGTVNDGDSANPGISADGRYVVFESRASTLVEGDLLGHRDIFLRDRATGKTRRISRGIGGAEADGASDDAAISANGRFIVYESLAGNIVAGVSTPWSNIYRFDRKSGKTRLVSRGIDGSGAGGSAPSVSSDGRYVVFEATNAAAHVQGGVNGLNHVFVRDMVEKQTRMIDVAGGVPGNANAFNAAISADGPFIAFSSSASNLVSDDLLGFPDVFIANLASGAVSRVTRGMGGAEANEQSGNPSMSADGRFVAFRSVASNLVPNDGNGWVDVFVFDRKTKKTTRVSVRTNGSEGLFGNGQPALSGDGRLVAFQAWGPLVASDTNGKDDIYVRGPLR
jgi:Tol biopolymer transport system component